MKLRRLTLAFALALPIFSAGCFGLFGSGEPSYSATISVLNDLDPSAPMTIELRKNGDDASTLGTVAGGAERALTYKSDDLQGAYQLYARQPSGAALVSREFTLFPGAQVRWQMRTNNVSVSQ